MAVLEQWGKLDLTGPGQAVLVLDVSGSAKGVHQEIVALAQQILEKLPGKIARKLFFLGNGNAHDACKFSVLSNRLLKENLDRASLISPVLQAIEPSPSTRIAVIGSGEIFDLEDWSHHAHLKNLLLVSMGDPMQPKGGAAKESLTREADEVCQFLCSSISKVVIGGKGFLPLHWDNEEYSLDLTSSAPVLVAKDADEYGLTLHYMCADSSSAQATLWEGRETSCVDLLPAEPVDPSPRLLGTLDNAEVAVFTQASRRQSFQCPRCGTIHEWNVVRCPGSGGILGARIYGSIPHSFVGLAAFRAAKETVEVHTYGDQTLPVEPGKVAIWKGGRAAIWGLDGASGQWTPCPHERLEPYFRMENGEYVVVL